MTGQDRYQRLKSIYLEARALRGEQRGRYLDSACAEDGGLRGEVEELLSLDSELLIAVDEVSGIGGSSFVGALPVATGTQVGPYQVEEAIGRGGMGVVYRAQDVRLGRHVALKFLNVGVGSSPATEGAVERFLSEARAASALDHPNVCTVHDFGVWEGHAFMAMAYYPGESLQDRLQGGPLPVAEAVEIAAQVAAGLAAAHAEGIVHRDVKPSNVLLSERGPVKILDFGLATHPGRERLTLTGLTVGTPGFMAPEQLKGEPVSPATDVWALGVLLYEMLTGQPPFRGETLPATVYSTVHEEPSDLRSERPEIPEWLEAVVSRCLRKDPAERFADAEEAYQALAAGSGPSLAASGEVDRAGARRAAGWAVVVALAALTAVAAALVPWWRQESQRRWLHAEGLPEIRRLAGESTAAAYRLAREARHRVADDPQLEQLWLDLTLPISLTTEPAGAEVEIRGFLEADGEWISVGRTPLEDVRLPLAMLRYRFTREGYAPVEAAPSVLPVAETFQLFTPEETPEGMVSVPPGTARLLFTGRHRPLVAELPQFWIGRFEVTNRQYLQFVEAGGYRRPELWRHPIEDGGRILSWAEAMGRFVDSTGLPGPSTWALGTYPEGEGEHPVEGVSWYEATAYAESVGKSLPTVFHWARAAFQGPGQNPNFSEILTVSNFAGRRSAPVGASGSLGPYGTFDLAGNVMEWCINASGPRRYIMGGSWNDTPYRFRDLDARLPLERRPGFGIRLIDPREPLAAELLEDVAVEDTEVPEVVDDQTFAELARRFEFDPAPLESVVESIDDDHEAWRREVVSFAAAYPGERVSALLFLPKRVGPPWQTVVHFPGGDALMVASSRDAGLLHIEPFLRSGRAVVYPIYRGTFERQLPVTMGPVARGNLLIQQVQDLQRTLDYLATRPDIDNDRLAYHGLSYGAYRSPFVMAIESRFKAAMVVSGGLVHMGQPPEIQQQNYLPRVRMPVLMVSGRDDFVFPYETSQRPFFELLGTPPERKRHVLLEMGHIFPRSTEAARELLAWVDLWLGPVDGDVP